MSDVYIELQRHGAYLKCTAIDPETGDEAVVIGPLRQPESLKRLAVQKLRVKQGVKPASPGAQSTGGTDIKV